MVSLNLNFTESNELKATPTGILIDTNWKNALYEFALKNIRHPAWGIAHSERDYQMTKILAEKEKVELEQVNQSSPRQARRDKNRKEGDSL